MKVVLRNPVVADAQQQDNNEDIVTGINQIGQFFYSGDPVPTFTPPGPALYFRTHPGSLEVYKYNGAWVVI